MKHLIFENNNVIENHFQGGVKIEFNENVEELSFFLEFDSESHFQATLYKTTNEEDLNTILRRSKTQKPGQAKGYVCVDA